VKRSNEQRRNSKRSQPTNVDKRRKSFLRLTHREGPRRRRNHQKDINTAKNGRNSNTLKTKELREYNRTGMRLTS